MKIAEILRAIMYASAAALLSTITVLTLLLYPEVRAEITDSRRVILSVGGTAAELRTSAKEWEAASRQSQEFTAESMQILKNLSTATGNLNSTASSLTALIQHTDTSINSNLAPELTQAIEQNNQHLAELVGNTNATILALGSTSRSAADAMAQATQTLAAAGKVIGDPAIPAILVNTQTTSKNVAETSADIQEKVHQMTRPASFAKRVAEATLTLAAPVITIFK